VTTTSLPPSPVVIELDQLDAWRQHWSAAVWARYGGMHAQLAAAMLECTEPGTLLVRADTDDRRLRLMRRAGYRYPGAVITGCARMVGDGLLRPADSPAAWHLRLPPPEHPRGPRLRRLGPGSWASR
jgi:hypothetical protein